MTPVLAERRAAVSVDELKRAWSAVQAGRFRRSPPSQLNGRSHGATDATRTWEPSAGEQVLPVLGCAGSCGASTVALALATAFGGDSRVMECSSMTASGLAAASTAELGFDACGWTRGSRGDVLLERVSDVLVRVDEVPAPRPPARLPGLTVLDVGWELGQVLTVPSWLSDQLVRADTVVLVTTATVPGLRRLETALDLLAGTAADSALAATRTVLAAIVGPGRRKWAKPVEYGAGPLTRAVDRAGHLLPVPQDRALAVAGLTPDALPDALLAAAAGLLGLTGAPHHEGIHDDR